MTKGEYVEAESRQERRTSDRGTLHEAKESSRATRAARGKARRVRAAAQNGLTKRSAMGNNTAQREGIGMAKKDKDKNPVGRPRKFKSAEAMQEAIAAYFKECDDNKSTFVTKDGLVMKVPDPMPYNVVGLALAIGLSRKQLLEYEHDYEDEFRNTVKIAKLKVEKAAADFTFRAKNPTGGIFNLKCNYGWQDKQVIEHQGEVAHNVHVIELPKKDGGKD